MTDDEMLEFRARTANAIVKKLKDARRESPVTIAIELLLNRIIGSGNSLRVLREHAPHEFTFDGAMILRGIYDTMLQALFILADPQHQETRAVQYLDYFWVEKHKAIHLFDNSDTYLGHRISNSPRRANTEPAIEQEFQKVRQKYEVGKKGKLRDHWYEGSLCDLAKDVGVGSEYDILQKQLSGIVHSSAYALQQTIPTYNELVLLNFAWRFSFRVLGKYAEYAKITLDKCEGELVRRSELNIFSDPEELR